MQYDELVKENARLQAEVERLNDVIRIKDQDHLEVSRVVTHVSKQRNELQSELTKALELLEHAEGAIPGGDAWQWLLDRIAAFHSNQSAPADKGQGEPVACAVFNDPLYNAESDARNASALLEEVIAWFDDGVGRSPAEFKLMRKIGDWLGRSVPRIDGGSDECDHSEANKIGCPECGEVFK